MVFAHDTETALATAAALVNTRSAQRDEELLPTPDELDAFVQEWGYTGSRRHDAAELEAVRGLRPVLRGIWLAEEDDAVRRLNALLADAGALPQLVRHDGWGWHVHATPPDAPLATRVAVEVAMALVDVVRGGERSRLRVCAADDCDHVVVDLSRNRSRRFCESGCGNRANVAAYRARAGARQGCVEG